MLSRFERHQAASYGGAAVPSKTMCRQTLTTLDGTERHRRFYLAVQTGRESSIILATADHSLRDPNPFRRSPPYEIQHIGRDPTIRSQFGPRANCSPTRQSTAVELLRACCKQCARPAMLTTIRPHC